MDIFSLENWRLEKKEEFFLNIRGLLCRGGSSFDFVILKDVLGE